MKIIINAASIFKGGAEQVVHSFITECKAFPENNYHIFLCDNILKVLDSESFPNNFYFYKLEKRPGSSFYSLYKSLNIFDDLEKQINPDVVISTGGHGYWNPKAPLVTAFNIPHYVYPESPYFNKISAKKKIYWKLKKKFDLSFYKKSDAIIVQTDDVNERVKKLLPEIDVYTVSNTVNGAFKNPQKYPKKLPEKKENEIRLLTVSSDYPHKNLEIIKPTIDVLLDNNIQHTRFVLTLPEEVFLAKFGEKRYRNYITNVGPVTIDECPALYDECDFMFLPTLLECFSASYVEAMATKKPILTSDLSFAKTICEDAAVYFDPLNPTDITNKIMNLIDQKETQFKLISKGIEKFKKINSPAKRAEKFLSICRTIVNEEDSKSLWPVI